MNIISPSLFFSLQSNFPQIPYTASEKYYHYLKKKGDNCIFLINNVESPSIGAIGRIKKVPILGSLLMIDGEILSDNISNHEVTDFYKEVIKLSYFGFEINSNNQYNEEYEVGIRRAGFLRSIFNLSCPLTKLIDLTGDVKYNRNWKKNYRKAIKSKLTFEEIYNPDQEIIRTFIDLFQEMSERKMLKFRLSYEGLLEMVDGESMRFFIVRSSQGEILSCRIIYVKEMFSADIFAVNTAKGNALGSSRFIVQSILEKLKNEGIETFDFGRIPPSSNETDGIYFFKNAIGGSIIQYNGEWVFYKNHLKEYMMLFLRRTIARPPRY